MGIHSTSPENTCRYLAVDIDQHGDDSDLAVSNFNDAIEILNRAAEIGIYGILEDSNGCGGFHVWFVFNEPVPTKIAYGFGQWLIGDKKHEAFPKQAELSEGKFGNWLRLPGRHHSRSHDSIFWGDGSWLNDTESVELWLNAPLNDPACLAVVPLPAVTLPEPNTRYDTTVSDSVVDSGVLPEFGTS